MHAIKIILEDPAPEIVARLIAELLKQGIAADVRCEPFGTNRARWTITCTGF
jgi:hypothetical protein